MRVLKELMGHLDARLHFSLVSQQVTAYMLFLVSQQEECRALKISKNSKHTSVCGDPNTLKDVQGICDEILNMFLVPEAGCC